MDDNKKYNEYDDEVKDKVEEVPEEEKEEEISYQYMSMDTSSDSYYDEPSQNGLFSVQRDRSSRKSSKFALILIILILVLSLTYAGIYFSKRLNNEDTESNTNTSEKQEEKKEEEIVEEEENPYGEIITDQKIIDMLNKKLETLDVQLDDRRTILFDKSRKIDEFSELDLISIALSNVKKENVANGDDYCYDVNTQKLEFKPAKCSYDNIIYYVVAKDLEMFYRSMFGIPLDKKNEYATCPRMLYNKEKDVYYLSASCGGAGYPTNVTYIYKYMEDPETAYIYVAYGVIAGNGDVYKDYDMKNLYKKEDYNFKITEANYKEFSRYKLVFEKKDNDLHFVYIQKLG